MRIKIVNMLANGLTPSVTTSYAKGFALSSAIGRNAGGGKREMRVAIIYIYED